MLAVRVVRVGVVFGHFIVEEFNGFKVVLTPHA